MNIVKRFTNNFKGTLKRLKEEDRLEAELVKKYAPRSIIDRSIHIIYVILFAASLLLALIIIFYPSLAGLNITNLKLYEFALLLLLLVAFMSLLMIQTGIVIARGRVIHNLYKEYQKLKKEKEN